MRFYPDNLTHVKQTALVWSSKQATCMFLNGNSYNSLYSSFPEIIAVGVKEEIACNKSCFNTLSSFLKKKDRWLFGYFGYDLKNELENVKSKNSDTLSFPLLYFFEPEILIRFHQDNIEILSENPEKVYEQILHYTFSTSNLPKIDFACDTSYQDYLEVTKKIKNHIAEGDVYELNYCIRYFSEVKGLDTFQVYSNLNEKSPTPFSTYLNTPQYSIMSASPERFIKKEGQKVISQPMKGTTKRGIDPKTDRANANSLRSSEKEQAENMMIVDLVRNDLAKSCKPGSVKVEDLFGVYPFPKVFQMISTVTGELKGDSDVVEVIKQAFPMGSMTGAPKIRAMQLIDNYENSFRGVFSGAAGYITPEKDFDFNVLIRSLFYSKAYNLLSFSVGSAITYDCDFQKEYEECLLKAENIFNIFS